jgi:anti-sigma regulatory factor (Ser/Thr protein kinase)
MTASSHLPADAVTVGTVELAPEPGQVAVARRYVKALLGVHGWDDDALGDVVVAVSELGANAILHAGTSWSVRCTIADGDATVEVTDQRPDVMPTVGGVPGATEVSGRGLALVQALASRWGIARHARSKTVWCLFHGPPPGSGPRFRTI